MEPSNPLMMKRPVTTFERLNNSSRDSATKPIRPLFQNETNGTADKLAGDRTTPEQGHITVGRDPGDA